MSKENPLTFTRANCDVVSEFARSNSLLKQTMNSESYWNRITIIDGSKYDKQMLLELIVTAVYPHELFPCMYREEDDDTFFLFKNGFSAVMALCARKLFLVNPETDENIELTITAQYLNASALLLDPMVALEDVIKKRIKDDKKLLDLRNLSGDPGMEDIYCSLNCLSFWDKLLAIKKKHMPTIHSWILSDNRMSHLDVLDPISSYEIPLLDLRNNQITSEGFRKISKKFRIGHLLLDGNPVTSEFETSRALVRFVKSRILVKKLDFLSMGDEERSLRCCTFPTFIVTPSYSSFVDHFMFHFFKRFEREKNIERKKLALMYHDDSSYSVSLFKDDPKPLTPSSASFLAVEIDAINHNLICNDASWKSKKYDNVFFGKVKIAKGLTKIPDIQFGYSTFSIDVPIANDRMVQIFVNGTCRASNALKQYYFSRSVLLVPSNKNNGEWLIVNDMWNFTHLKVRTPKQWVQTAETVKGDFAVMLNPQLKDKTILRRLVKKMTKMKAQWVDKFLDESDWDLEFTLQSFTDQFKADVIPVDAFDIPEEKLKSLYPLVQALRNKQAQLGISSDAVC